MSVTSRFWAKVEVGDECWTWTAGCISTGYGALHPTKGTTVLAHRFSYELHHGPIPQGMVVDHECHNRTDCRGGKECPHRKCVNPAHLRLRTNQENLRAGPQHNSKKTQCRMGHEYTPQNTRIHRSGSRSCRTCAADQDRKRDRKKRR